MEGKAVLMVVILAKESLPTLIEELGSNDTAPWIGDPRVLTTGGLTQADIDRNTGPGKRFPGGVNCFYNGKTVPMLVLNSSKGSMTSKLLVRIL